MLYKVFNTLTEIQDYFLVLSQKNKLEENSVLSFFLFFSFFTLVLFEMTVSFLLK